MRCLFPGSIMPPSPIPHRPSADLWAISSTERLLQPASHFASVNTEGEPGWWPAFPRTTDTDASHKVQGLQPYCPGWQGTVRVTTSEDIWFLMIRNVHSYLWSFPLDWSSSHRPSTVPLPSPQGSGLSLAYYLMSQELGKPPSLQFLPRHGVHKMAELWAVWSWIPAYLGCFWKQFKMLNVNTGHE